MEAKRELLCGGDAVEVEVEFEDVDAWLAEEAELTALSVLSDELADGGFKIVDANKQGIAYVYGHADPRDAGIAKALTLDEARRIAANIAKLPTLLRQRDG